MPALPVRPFLAGPKEGVALLKERRPVDEGANLLREVGALLREDTVDQLRRSEVELLGRLAPALDGEAPDKITVSIEY